MRSHVPSLIVLSLLALACGDAAGPETSTTEQEGAAATATSGAQSTMSGGAAGGSRAATGGASTSTAGSGPAAAQAGSKAPSAGSQPTASGNMAAGASGASASKPQAGTTAAMTATAGASGAPAAGSGEAAAGTTATPQMGAALSDMQTLIPDASWDCGMPEGIPGPATGTEAFTIDFTVKEVHDLKQTQFGHRLQIDISGGKASGAKLDATVMDRGLDYQVTLDNGVVELEQIHILQAGSSPVLMRNCGLAPSDNGQVRVVLDFEAPNSSSVAFLNMGKFIGVREFDAAAKKLTMKVYEVTAAADKANAVTIPAPPAGPHNTWACKVAMGRKGAEVYRESVGIGGSVSVGDSKRGTRNIIPITGGSTTGKVPGKVLSGGADFQIIANGTFSEIDARYSVVSDEGEVIIVRNCGPLGGLVPVFETSKDGKYAWLNENTWLSSDPGLGVGAVNLTIYETQ